MPVDAAEAIRLLYRQHGETVYQTIYGIVLDAGHAQDLTRDAFVRAYRGWEPSGPADARAWLLGTATRLAIASCRTWRHWWRTAPRMAREDRDVEGPVAVPSHGDRVVRLMRPLNPEQRALVMLR